jgi:guanylate kinase
MMKIEIERRGLMLVLSSPSGAGKTTLARELLSIDPHLKLSISTTTRPPRPGEKEGKDYHFTSAPQFEDSVAAGEFLEYAKVFGNLYGTPRQPVEEALSLGDDVLFDIDWQGTQQLAQIMRNDLVSVFILPPSRAILLNRLKTRAQDGEDVIQHRMGKASDEISHWAEYDYVIINETLSQSISHLSAILTAERLRRSRQPGLTEFISTLRKEENRQN